ncbi:MAG: hypothetical protein RSD49_08885 [Hafnia sp.]
MMQFRAIEHAITEDGEWVTPEELPLDYRRRLLCDSCHAEVAIDEDKSGKEIFIHSRHNRSERIKNQSCHYAIRPSTQLATTDIDRKRKQPLAGYAGLRGPLNTGNTTFRLSVDLMHHLPLCPEPTTCHAPLHSTIR